ncbi:MAG: hypothetical protein HKN37_06735 [Rhodothermales bacterium]|nr:hypothetical protein [Rhodothermales bacterium]
MKSLHLVLSLSLLVGVSHVPAHGQTSKFRPGDTLMVPPMTPVDVIDGDDFTTEDTLLAVLVGKKYPFWFVDFDLSNEIEEQWKVGNSFFLNDGVENLSISRRSVSPDRSRKLSRMGVSAQNAGGNVEQAVSDLVAAGIPVLLNVTFEVADKGGVEPKIRIYNVSKSRIRSVEVAFQGFDSDGNLVHCIVSGSTDHVIQLKGPIEPDGDSYYSFVNDPAFMNAATTCLEIDSVTIELMGGESVVLDDELSAIQNILAHPFMRKGECRGP